MRVVVFSRSSRIASTRRLVEAARARGHHARVIDPSALQLVADSRGARLLVGRKTLRCPELVVPRFAASVTSFGLPMVEQLVHQGAAALNDAHGLEVCRSAAGCLQRLASAGVAIPRTVMARDAQVLKTMVDHVGGLPVLLKLLHRSDKGGVMRCESPHSLEAALEAVLGLGHDVVMQEYVTAPHRELRVIVVGGRALAAAARVPRKGPDAPRLERAALTPEVSALTERAAGVCGLELCAVDVLEGKLAPRVFDVHACPALPELEALCSVDLAAAIIARGEQLVAARAPIQPGP